MEFLSPVMVSIVWVATLSNDARCCSLELKLRAVPVENGQFKRKKRSCVHKNIRFPSDGYKVKIPSAFIGRDNAEYLKVTCNLKRE